MYERRIGVRVFCLVDIVNVFEGVEEGLDEKIVERIRWRGCLLVIVWRES